MSYTIDIDTGGTFTDGFFSDGSRYRAVKVDTTPQDLTLGFQSCIENGAARLGFSHIRELLRETEIIRFSTTLGTNLLIERRGPKLGLIVTAGFESSLHEGGAESIFDFLVDPEMVVGIEEEVNEEGRILRTPLELEVVQKARSLLERGARVLVVCLQGVSRNAENERQVKRILDLHYPPHYLGSVPVLLSHQVSLRPEIRWRTHAAVINAYLHGQLSRSLYRAEDYIRQNAGMRPLLIVHADGGTTRVAKTRAIDTYNSGPTAALYGALALARQLGLAQVVTLDIGGTSSDIAVLREESPPLTPHGRIAGLNVGRPSLDIGTLGGGGGSIAHFTNNILEVGPQSAGALPGPACYDLGGFDPTVTDAAVVLGYLDPGYFLGGRRRLHAERAAEVIGQLARQVNASFHETARQVLRRLEHNVAQAIRQKIGTEGLSSWTLFAFGGAGGLHAASIADRLGLRTIHTFPFGSVFSAFGSSALDVVHVYESFLDGKARLESGNLLLEGWFQELMRTAIKDMQDEGFSDRKLDFQVQIEVETPSRQPLVYTYSVEPEQRTLALDLPPQLRCRVVMARLRATAPVRHHGPTENSTEKAALIGAMKGRRQIYWPDAAAETAVYQREKLPFGSVLEGPVLVESEETTVVVPAGWQFRVDPSGNGVLTTD